MRAMVVDLRARAFCRLIRGVRAVRELREMGRELRVLGEQLLGATRETLGTARERRDLARDIGVARRLEVRGIAVPPPVRKLPGSTMRSPSLVSIAVEFAKLDTKATPSAIGSRSSSGAKGCVTSGSISPCQ